MFEEESGRVRSLVPAVASAASLTLKQFMAFFAAQGFGLKFELLKVDRSFDRCYASMQRARRAISLPSPPPSSSTHTHTCHLSPFTVPIIVSDTLHRACVGRRQQGQPS